MNTTANFKRQQSVRDLLQRDELEPASGALGHQVRCTASSELKQAMAGERLAPRLLDGEVEGLD